jgi:hypothetical protein
MKKAIPNTILTGEDSFATFGSEKIAVKPKRAATRMNKTRRGTATDATNPIHVLGISSHRGCRECSERFSVLEIDINLPLL